MLGVREHIFLGPPDVDWHTPLPDAGADADAPIMEQHHSQIVGLATAFGEERWTRAMARKSFRRAERKN